MRLSDVLSKPPKSEFVQVDAFLLNKKGDIGQQVNLEVGKVALNFFCSNCDDTRTYYSKGKLCCIFVNERIISIDCVLNCDCGSSVQMWFLVESEERITGAVPKVRILKRNEKLSSGVKFDISKYGEYSELLMSAQRAFRERLGAGAIVYLRKAYEKITKDTADAVGIDYKKHSTGNPKNFAELLKTVDEQCHIIPREFSENRYTLFQELSGVVHGEFDEELGLLKFESLYRLVVGILENVKNNGELRQAATALGWTAREEAI